MKYIKKYEYDSTYDINDINDWWTGIKITEDDDYYIIDLNSVYLTNKKIQLDKGLKNKTVKFYCRNHMKYEELNVKNVNSYEEELIFKTSSENGPNDIHSVDTTKPIMISKLQININKYNI
jgi:hypothetical protein